MTYRSPIDVIASITMGDGCIENLDAESAKVIVEKLESAGFYICRMDGGVHNGTCPTCGCEPAHIRDGELARNEKEG